MIFPNLLHIPQRCGTVRKKRGVAGMLYDEIIASWHEKKIRTAADIALEMNEIGRAHV